MSKNDRKILDIALTARDALYEKSMRYIIKDDASVDSWAVVYNTGKVDQHASSACIGSLRPKSNGISYFISWPFLYRYKKGPLKKYEEDYISWMARHSPFAPAFKTKRPDLIYGKGALLKADVPACIVAQAHISLRYLSEYPSIPQTWDVLRQHLDPYMSWLLAHYFKVFPNNNSFLQTNGLGYYQGHSCFMPGHMTYDAAKRLVKCDRSGWNRLPPLSDHANYYPLNKGWNIDIPHRDGMVYSWKQNGDVVTIKDEFVKEHTIEDVWGWTDKVEGTSISDLPAIASQIMEG